MYEFITQPVSVQFNGLSNNPLNYLVAAENLIITYQDYQERFKLVKQSEQENFSVSVVLPVGDEFDMLIYLLSLLNGIDINIKIFCSADLVIKAAEYSNMHIEFFDINCDEIIIGSDVVITYGLSVLYFVKKEIPVLIIGPYGIGGWVTPGNFMDLYSNGFLGRVGGELWEIVSPDIFKDELFLAKNNFDLEVILTENRNMANLLPYIPHSSSVLYIENRKNRLLVVLDNDKRWAVIPSLASNLRFIKSDQDVFIRRAHLNDTIAIISHSDSIFFDDITGENSFRYIFDKHDMSEDDFWGFIYSLIEKSIVVIK
ncbi:hypothetical protein HGH93_02410 [Chitinophaga polysaccharea]|uniref:hypothetical protein n=1 Tax=Chitinophaga polysaccharea TaxID=1293035 RepID=UPI00145581D6|nr:hypothetical protein [Chitinophaga polysaccharea]NLR56937.1 hypothetical protein [Chitinophaga polysaccharea]